MNFSGEALRDRFFELSAKASADAETFKAQVNQVDVDATTRVNGLRVCFHPTVRFKAVRFFDAALLSEDVRPLFARPSPGMPELAAGFVDPEEFSFRTFENIVPLDRFFAQTPLELALKNRARAGKKDVYTFTLEANAEARGRLQKLDTLGLYTPPLNAGSRGGERFIFHSAQLADALTTAVKGGLGASLLGNFSHVNPVFRCNAFEPGDEKFHEHFDTPYFDPNRNHVSRYTLLIYLTAGTGSPALRVEGDDVLSAVDAFTCVVMHQKYPHEGRAFDAAGRKVFLRTELIFKDAKVEHDPAIAAAFSKACYLTGESVFAGELSKWADAAYNRVASAHWNGLAATADAEPFVHKEFRGTGFVSNGYDYWFDRSSHTLPEAAALALLDYFNAEVGSIAFRKACTTTVVKPENAAAIASLLEGSSPREAVSTIDKAMLFPAPEKADADACCPFHAPDWQPTRGTETVDLYARAQQFVKRRLLPAPVWMMGEQVFLDPGRFVIDGTHVHVLSEKALQPVNFAACWNFGGSPPNYLGVEATVTALQPLVPPLLFREVDGCWHLQLDLFRNSWFVSHERQELPVPRLLDIDPGEAEDAGEEPWFEAVDESTARPSENGDSAFWWGDSSAVVRELGDLREAGDLSNE